jgi:hypothetical protein
LGVLQLTDSINIVEVAMPGEVIMWMSFEMESSAACLENVYHVSQDAFQQGRGFDL